MNKMRQTATLLYKHHFVRYLLVGGTTFIIDFSLLFSLRTQAHFSLALATTIGYWVSIVYNFFLNRWWSFSVTEIRNLHKHATTYGVLLGFNYIFTLTFISLTSQVIYFAFAKIIAVLISMSWTYVIYKNYIFTKKTPSGTTSDTTAAISKA